MTSSSVSHCIRTGEGNEPTSLAVLCQGLHLCCLDPCASYPNGTLDDDCSDHGENGSWWQLRHTVVTTWQELLDRFLQNLEERYDHEDGKDQDADWFEASAADWELLSQTLHTPAYKLVGSPDDDCAEQVKGGIDEGCNQGEGAGPNGCYTFGCEEKDVYDYVDLYCQFAKARLGSVLTLIAHLACLADFARLLRSSSGRKGSKSSPLLPNGPRSSATPSPSTSRGFILSTMSSASEETTMSTSAQSSRRSFCSS